MRLKRKLAVALVLLLPIASNADLILVDFEDTDEGASLPSVTSRGFTFTGSENPGGFPLMAVRDSPTATTGDPSIADSGSRYLVHSDSGGASDFFPSITMTANNSRPFTLLGFQLGEDNTGTRFAETLQLTGVRANGDIVVTEILLDGFNDGYAGRRDFQIEVLGLFFRNLVSLEFLGLASEADSIAAGPTQAFSIDNLLVVQVPEPSTLALLGLGLAGIGFASRKKA
jgi:hypothetical protein